MNSLLDRNIHVALLISGLGNQDGLRNRNLNNLRNNLPLNAARKSSTILRGAILRGETTITSETSRRKARHRGI